MSFHREKNEQTEFDFDTDKYDIRIPADLDEVTGRRGYKKQERQDQIVPESDYSLRVMLTIHFFPIGCNVILHYVCTWYSMQNNHSCSFCIGP